MRSRGTLGTGGQRFGWCEGFAGWPPVGWDYAAALVNGSLRIVTLNFRGFRVFAQVFGDARIPMSSLLRRSPTKIISFILVSVLSAASACYAADPTLVFGPIR